jgi:hypothetical protein
MKSPFDFGAKRTSLSKTAPSSMCFIPLFQSNGLHRIYQMLCRQEILLNPTGFTSLFMVLSEKLKA